MSVNKLTILPAFTSCMNRKRVFAICLFATLLVGGLWSSPSNSDALSNKKAEGKQLATHALQLLMFDEDGCPYCERWKQDIGVIYNKTPEGRRAPLSIVNIETTLEQYKIKAVTYTPTFVLTKNQHEVGRIVGYIDEGFFWSMLDDLIKKAEAQAKPGG